MEIVGLLILILACGGFIPLIMFFSNPTVLLVLAIAVVIGIINSNGNHHS